MVQFASELRKLRRSRGQSQFEFGELVGVPQPTISKWEAGKNMPSLEHFKQIQQAVGPEAARILAAVFIQADESSASLAKGFEEMQQARGPVEGMPPPQKRHPLFGSMKGTSIVMPGVDLTQPADPEWGKVYDDDFDHGVIVKQQGSKSS